MAKDRRSYYKKWRAENKGHVRSYETSRKGATNSRKRARRALEKKLGKGAVANKSVDHINGNPHDNRVSNLRLKPKYHGFDAKRDGKKKKSKKK